MRFHLLFLDDTGFTVGIVVASSVSWSSSILQLELSSNHIYTFDVARRGSYEIMSYEVTW